MSTHSVCCSPLGLFPLLLSWIWTVVRVFGTDGYTCTNSKGIHTGHQEETPCHFLLQSLLGSNGSKENSWNMRILIAGAVGSGWDNHWGKLVHAVPRSSLPGRPAHTSLHTTQSLPPRDLRLWPTQMPPCQPRCCLRLLFISLASVCFHLLIEHCHKIIDPLLAPQEVGENVLVTTDTSLPHSKYGFDFLSPCFSLLRFSLTCTFLLYIY